MMLQVSYDVASIIWPKKNPTTIFGMGNSSFTVRSLRKKKMISKSRHRGICFHILDHINVNKWQQQCSTMIEDNQFDSLQTFSIKILHFHRRHETYIVTVWNHGRRNLRFEASLALAVIREFGIPVAEYKIKFHWECFLKSFSARMDNIHNFHSSVQ